MYLTEPTKNKLNEIAIAILSIVIFLALSLMIFIYCADAAIILPDRRAYILAFAALMAVILPSIILILLNKLNKADLRNDELELEIDSLKNENQALKKRLKEFTQDKNS